VFSLFDSFEASRIKNLPALRRSAVGKIIEAADTPAKQHILKEFISHFPDNGPSQYPQVQGKPYWTWGN
jgi:hypothetical protein